MTESPLVDSSFDVPVFSLGDDLISCLNKAMAFLTVVSSSREDKGKVILVLGIKPKLTRNAAWYKEKAMLAEAQEAGQFLDKEQLAFLADPVTDLDTYDSYCDDISNAKAVLMVNISNYGSGVISEAIVKK
nr:hypothetical protein [Tanacetum cinerariifolium]